MLTICGDLDQTPDRHVYREIMGFLNTTETTSMGPGVGLEVGNTIYFDMPPDQFAYWNTDDAGREMVRALIRSGHIDCLHSYGDLAMRREHAGSALDELARHDCRVEIWVDHGTAPTNFDPGIGCGHGDEIGHEAYHADLTIGYGVRFVWRGRVTSVIGQDVPPSLGGLYTAAHPVDSARTLAKETAKNVLGRLGHAKYRMHAANHVFRRSRLRDESPVYEFLRSNPHWGGVSSHDTGREIGDVLTERILSRLIEREGVCVLYTHLGKVRDPRVPFEENAVAAFRRLAEAYHSGRIVVLTTRRALRYLTARDRISWTAHRENDLMSIDGRIREPDGDIGMDVSRGDLGGLTFYVPDGLRYRVSLEDEIIEDVRVNPPDHTGRRSVSLPMSRLTFPEI